MVYCGRVLCYGGPCNPYSYFICFCFSIIYLVFICIQSDSHKYMVVMFVYKIVFLSMYLCILPIGIVFLSGGLSPVCVNLIISSTVFVAICPTPTSLWCLCVCDILCFCYTFYSHTVSVSVLFGSFISSVFPSIPTVVSLQFVCCA